MSLQMQNTKDDYSLHNQTLESIEKMEPYNYDLNSIAVDFGHVIVGWTVYQRHKSCQI